MRVPCARCERRPVTSVAPVSAFNQRVSYGQARRNQDLSFSGCYINYLGDPSQRSGLPRALHGERRWLHFSPGGMSGQFLSQRQAAATEAAFDGSLRDA